MLSQKYAPKTWSEYKGNEKTIERVRKLLAHHKRTGDGLAYGWHDPRGG